jgi:hypothetical protein
MPSRIIREGIISSPRINELSIGAEVLYRRLMSVVDDYGRFHASAVTIRGACWPTCPNKISEQDVDEWIAELEIGPRPLVVVYESSGCLYLQITDFKQQLRTKSKFPEPCEQSDNKPLRNASPRRESYAYAYSYSYAKAREEKTPDALAPETKPASQELQLVPPANCEARIRAAASECPNSQDFEAGVKLAVDHVKASADPESTLELMEANFALWFIAMREGHARFKSLRYIVVDKDYLQKPRDPPGKNGAKTDRNQKRRMEVHSGLEELERARKTK